MKADNFLQIPFEESNLDLYYIRTSILNAIKNELPNFKGKLLDVGCGRMPYKKLILENSEVEQYVGLDLQDALVYDQNIKPDQIWDGISMPFGDLCFDFAFATEVLEHCTDPAIILNEVYRILKPGGSFFFTIPFLWPLHEVPHDEYRYTPFSINRLLKAAGFDDICIKGTGGWHASLAQMIGLWVRRAPLSGSKKKYLSFVAKQIIRKLLKWENRAPVIDFKESQMITGLYGITKKK